MNQSDIRNSPEFTAATLMTQAGDYLSGLGHAKMQLLLTQQKLAEANARIEELTKGQEP